ncbi:Rossmann-like and DUF2520 domain-containing protein [Parolsenella sp. LCP21S3_E11]|uniref:Rossmann-like and DUF2520 domain-containing protein n=1 Tax=Parolsenella sp. LCP21S3_E11 TaxID=3438797 RepID=UPI003F99C686
MAAGFEQRTRRGLVEEGAGAGAPAPSPVAAGVAAAGGAAMPLASAGAGAPAPLVPAADAWGDAIAAAPERIPAPKHAARATAEGAPVPPRVCAGPGRLRLAVVGAGKVGCSLGRYLGESAAVDVVGFCSHDEAHAREAVEFAGGAVFASPIEAARAANLLLVTTPDTSIADVWAELARAARAGELSLRDKLVVHCSGALASGIFAGARELGAHVCSAHPLYAVSSRFDCWREFGRASFTLEGDDWAVGLMAGLLRARGNQVSRIAAGAKTRYHAAAVMASNLVVGLFDMAAGELVRCGFDRVGAEAALAPLFLGNAEHIAKDGVEASLTGPAVRGDHATIDAHLARLEGRDRQAYQLLTEQLVDIVRRRATEG